MARTKFYHMTLSSPEALKLAQYGDIFLDSGAHSLYNEHVLKKTKEGTFTGEDGYRLSSRELESAYSYYDSKAFWKYVDEYASFLLHAAGRGVNFYVNVDAIHHPEISYKVLKHLEGYGLSPLPVLHFGTPIEWLHKHLDEGYDFIGFGGVGRKSHQRAYVKWADEFWKVVCAPPSYIPRVKVHGFAMTSWNLITRYPWYSVDSATWIKSAAFGNIMFPRKKNGKHSFDVAPLTVGMTPNSPRRNEKGGHWLTLRPEERKMIAEWLEFINVPLGALDENEEPIEYGCLTHHHPRAQANCIYLHELAKSRPKWPFPWAPKQTARGFFDL